MKKPKTMTKKAVRSFLIGLGKSAEQVATSLRRRKIKGDTDNPTSCPLYFALKREFRFNPEKLLVQVGSDEVRAIPEGCTRWDDETTVVPLPKACRNFVEMFDNEKFVDLIEV